MAVAVAAAIAANTPYPQGSDFLKEVLPFVPESITKERIQFALRISADELEVAAQSWVPAMKLRRKIRFHFVYGVPLIIWIILNKLSG
jgi:hypothetical protein